VECAARVDVNSPPSAYCQSSERNRTRGPFSTAKLVPFFAATDTLEFTAGAVLVADDRRRCGEELAVLALVLPDGNFDVPDPRCMLGAACAALGFVAGFGASCVILWHKVLRCWVVGRSSIKRRIQLSRAFSQEIDILKMCDYKRRNV